MKDGKFNKQASLDLVSSLKTKNPELYKQVEKINNKCSEESKFNPYLQCISIIELF